MYSDNQAPGSADKDSNLVLNYDNREVGSRIFSPSKLSKRPTSAALNSRPQLRKDFN